MSSIYNSNSPEFLLALNYFQTNSQGKLGNPTVATSRTFSGPLGVIEDTQVSFPAPANAPAFIPYDPNPAGRTGQPDAVPVVITRPAVATFGIDYFTLYTNDVLDTLSDPHDIYQYFAAPMRWQAGINVLAQLQTAVVNPPPDGTLWIGAKRTNKDKADAVGDQRSTAPTMPGVLVPGSWGQTAGLIPIGTQSTYNGLVWTLTLIPGIFFNAYWLATATAGA